SLRCFLVLPALSSFPTRRSSDLAQIDRFFPPEHSIGTGLFLEDFAIVDGDPQRAVLQAIELHQEGLRPVVLEQRNHQLPLAVGPDRKSTRLNSSHLGISYAVFCL